ncbi:right-handed parallel beta-helix repeat-containing protein [Acaryochloris sp. 'Moss Beach']|uniref:right-handed parallel beta-helix repeat-containing protein n=1 Tax=Acaryochloris sp. 'Moss Beach' TaxID=2740837 RepID=UPI001F454C37|nr:right-handed parallel beta-helix repeat-containing protein [Acaryochloris sp. 'Moss Beach']UJB68559.1 right-handed parallel beta-helix repeat-containing protein [Acaryochloris sp. 'Moss Beach']
MKSRGTLQSTPRLPHPSSGMAIAWASLTSFLAIAGLISTYQNAHAQTVRATTAPVQVTVNSPLDGEIKADEVVTLREAIAITNGVLNKGDLSEAEQAQIAPSTDHSRIDFDLPRDNTTIRLQALLPTVTNPGLLIDGTSQAGYALAEGDSSAPAPVVALTPAEDTEVFRGLTLAADKVHVRALSLYGFTSIHQTTATTPPADIFIAHRLLPSKRLKEDNPQVTYPYDDERDLPPQGILIEESYLGITPQGTAPTGSRSAFGVSIYNAIGTRILNNQIAHHDGSAVITSVRAEQTEIANNIIEQNGLAGMPDAIRLEGDIDGTKIHTNQIQQNAGSAVYLFKPEGSVMIEKNLIADNGQRFRRAAILLMGDNHHVVNNTIQDQPGPGVVITSYPTSQRNFILDNRFANLDGLSIDLIARENRFLDRFSRISINRVDLAARSNTRVQDYQVGDGPNPLRNSDQRKRDTANRGLNTPQFLSSEFYLMEGAVNLDGEADPGTEIVLYKVMEEGKQGPLNEPVTMVKSDEEGRFAITLTDANAGDRFSAIAIHPDYGTSEPARNAIVIDLK